MPDITTTFPRVWHNRLDQCEAGSPVAQTVSVGYRLHFQAIRRYSYAILRNLSEAEDVAQETFIRLIQALDRDSEIENLLPWLLRVAHNLSLSRASRRPPERQLEDADCDFVADGSPNPEQMASRKQQELWLQNALARLSPQELRCWTLRAEGLRYREIAEILGVRAGTVATLLVRATEKLSVGSQNRRPEVNLREVSA